MLMNLSSRFLISIPCHCLFLLFYENICHHTVPIYHKLNGKFFGYYIILLRNFVPGYVSKVKKALLYTSIVDLEGIYNRYKAKEPAPLNSQFKQRLEKKEAITCYQKRKSSTVALFPEGI